MMFIRSPGRFPRGFAGMMGLVLCVEAFIGGNGESFRHPWAWDWFLADGAAREKVEDCEVLCFGDSQMKFGVSPRVIERASGWKAYNLAVGVGQAPGSYFLLRRALEAGARPKAVLIDAIPHTLSAGPDYNAKLWPELLSYRDCLELSLGARDPNFLASMTLAKLFPSVRDRSEIRDAVTAALRGGPPPIGANLLPYLRNWTVNLGAQVTKSPPSTAPHPVDAWAPALFPDSWRPSRLNTDYLGRFFRLAAANGIRVYWLLPPFDPEVQARREANGRDAEYVAFVKALQAEHPGVVVLDARHSGYGEDTHLDPIHLDVRGASALSRDLAAVLRRGPAPHSRWEVLPAFRDIPPGVALEDVDQSAAVVARKGRR